MVQNGDILGGWLTYVLFFLAIFSYSGLTLFLFFLLSGIFSYSDFTFITRRQNAPLARKELKIEASLLPEF